MVDKVVLLEPSFRSKLLEYITPSIPRSIFELLITSCLFVTFVVSAYLCSSWSYFLSIPFIILSALTQVRLFILQHDLGHGGLFPNKVVRVILGNLLSILCAIPYFYWAKCHSIHHATANNIDKQNLGSIDLLTVEAYKKLSRTQKWIYRIMHNPWSLLFVISAIYFYFYNRLASSDAKQHPQFSKLELFSPYYTNVLIAMYLFLVIYFLGFMVFLKVLVPIFIVAGMIGMLLFYVQHNFPEAYVARDPAWDPTRAAMQGSSFFKLPFVLRWFTGNIGYHHIHHLLPKIPFYNLPRMYEKHPELQAVNTIRIRDIPKLFQYKLWDEACGKLITWREFKNLNQ